MGVWPMKRCFIRIWAALLTAALLAGLCGVPAMAAEEDEEEAVRIRALPYADTRTLLPRIDILDDMESPFSDTIWTADAGVESVSLVRVSGSSPYSPFCGGQYLAVAGGESRFSDAHTVRRAYDVPLDLSAVDSLFAAVCCPALPDGDAALTVTLEFAEGRRFSFESTLTCGVWNGVTIDIRGIEDRAQLEAVAFSVRQAVKSDARGSFTFYLDCFGAAEGCELASALTFLTDRFNFYGGTSRVGDSNGRYALRLAFESTAASQCFLETPRLPAIFEGAGFLRVRLSNASACSALRAEFSSGSAAGYGEFPSVTVPVGSSGGVQVCDIPLPSEEVEQIKITFVGAIDGEMEIYSILPFSDYEWNTAEYAAALPDGIRLTACRISEDGQNVVIRGVCDAPDTLSGSTLEVVELGAGQNALAALDSAYTPLASGTVSAEFALTFPLYDGERSRICAEFAVILSNKEKKLFVGNPRCVTNPEDARLGGEAVDELDIFSKKGLITTSGTAMDAHISHTRLTVDVAQLFGAGIDFPFEGGSYSFSHSYVSQLDDALRDSWACGIRTVLSLVLTRPDDNSLADLLLPAGSDGGHARYYAFNTESEPGVQALRAACAFLAQRYLAGNSGHGHAAGVIVGDGIDNMEENYWCGERNLPDFTRIYERAFRIVYNTVRSYNPEIEIYLSFGNSWDSPASSGRATRFCGRDLLLAMNTRIRAGGDVAWSAVFDPYRSGDGQITDWKGSAALEDAVTLTALPALCGFLRGEQLHFDGASRGVLLLHDQRDSLIAADESRLIAESIAAYYSVNAGSCASVEALVVTDPCPGSAAYAEVLRVLDTPDAAEVVSLYKSALGIDAWNEILPEFQSSAPALRQFLIGALTQSLPEGIAGSVPLCTFTETQPGWYTSGAGRSLQFGSSYKGYHDMLLLDFQDAGDDGVYLVSNMLEYSRDLSFAPYVSFTMLLDNLPQDVRSVTLTVEVTGQNSVYRASAEVEGGMWRNLVCDLSDFAGVKSVERITLRISGADGVYLQGVQLALSEIDASSTKYDSDFLQSKFDAERKKHLDSHSAGEISDNRIAWILLCVIVGAATLEVLNILARVRFSAKGKTRRFTEEDFR